MREQLLATVLDVVLLPWTENVKAKNRKVYGWQRIREGPFDVAPAYAWRLRRGKQGRPFDIAQDKPRAVPNRYCPDNRLARKLEAC